MRGRVSGRKVWLEAVSAEESRALVAALREAAAIYEARASVADRAASDRFDKVTRDKLLDEGRAWRVQRDDARRLMNIIEPLAMAPEVV